MKLRWSIPLIVIVGIFTIIVPILLVVFAWGTFACAMYNHIENAPSPGKPAITRAEFPFTLVYEVDGEEIVLNDTLICEYKGDRWNDGDGKKFRHWEDTYSSGVDEIILAEKSFEDYDVSIVFADGYSPAYLMGDTEHYNYDCSKSFGAQKITYDPPFTSTTGITKAEMYEEYGVKIVSFEMYAQPIGNSFAPTE